MPGNLTENCLEGLRGRAGDQQVVPGGNHAPGDRGDLGRSLALAEDDFGKALSCFSVVIDAGEPQVFVGLLAQNLKELFLGRLRCHRAGLDGL